MRNHNKDLFYAEANQKQRFSIRKLTIGAASVLLCTAFYLGNNGSVAHADEINEPNTTQTEKSQNGGYLPHLFLRMLQKRLKRQH